MPPQPPTPVLPTAGEIHDYVSPFDTNTFRVDNLPYGLGPRVGMIVVSPWSKGGFVCSQVFDHTSIIRFIERRFGVSEPNITEWRRAVSGDLTSAFDFAAPREAWPELPDTRGYIAAVNASCKLPDPVVLSRSTASDLHPQEPGVRPARPLPYDLAVDEIGGEPGALALRFASFGAAGACFTVYREQTEETPRRYTAGSGQSVDDEWSLDGPSPHIITVAGTNGFVRRYRRSDGSCASARGRTLGLTRRCSRSSIPVNGPRLCRSATRPMVRPHGRLPLRQVQLRVWLGTSRQAIIGTMSPSMCQAMTGRGLRGILRQEGRASLTPLPPFPVLTL